MEKQFCYHCGRERAKETQDIVFSNFDFFVISEDRCER